MVFPLVNFILSKIANYQFNKMAELSKEISASVIVQTPAAAAITRVQEQEQEQVQRPVTTAYTSLKDVVPNAPEAGAEAAAKRKVERRLEYTVD